MPEEADWDIATGVGMSALGVAGLRAIESHHAAALVRDPYAAAFVHAAAGQLQSPLPTTPEEAAGSDPDFPWLLYAAYVGVRSRFFDTFLETAAEAGIRQLVILAAGLDTRAFRLDWPPPGVTVYEVDAPLVIAFKNKVLAEQGARARCARRPVTTDLREDWPSALRRAGFDPGLQTAWIAEGLFPYLSDDAKQALLASVHEHSAPGSRLAVEHLGTDLAELLNDQAVQEVARRVNWNFAAILPTESDQRRDVPASWLGGHGWAVAVTPATMLAETYGRPFGEGALEAARASILISATRNA